MDPFLSSKEQSCIFILPPVPEGTSMPTSCRADPPRQQGNACGECSLLKIVFVASFGGIWGERKMVPKDKQVSSFHTVRSQSRTSPGDAGSHMECRAEGRGGSLVAQGITAREPASAQRARRLQVLIPRLCARRTQAISSCCLTTFPLTRPLCFIVNDQRLDVNRPWGTPRHQHRIFMDFSQILPSARMSISTAWTH